MLFTSLICLLPATPKHRSLSIWQGRAHPSDSPWNSTSILAENWLHHHMTSMRVYVPMYFLFKPMPYQPVVLCWDMYISRFFIALQASPVTFFPHLF
jgi:hypothetical protein